MYQLPIELLTMVQQDLGIGELPSYDEPTDATDKSEGSPSNDRSLTTRTDLDLCCQLSETCYDNLVQYGPVTPAPTFGKVRDDTTMKCCLTIWATECIGPELGKKFKWPKAWMRPP